MPTNEFQLIYSLSGGSSIQLTAREEDQSRREGRRGTSLATASAGRNGVVDGSRVVGHTVTLGTKVLDVAVDLVAARVAVVRRSTKMCDVLEPVRITCCRARTKSSRAASA